MAEPRRIRVDWTQFDDTLIRMVRAGRTTRDIATALGAPVTRNAVIGRMHRLRLEHRLEVMAPPPPKAARRPGFAQPGLPAVAGEKPVAVRRNGHAMPDKVLHKERQRQGVNHVFGLAAARLAIRAEAARAPASERFADGFLGQTGRVALTDLESCHCRFPIDMADGTVRSCGLTPIEGSSYCTDHHLRCYDGIPAPKARAAWG